MKWLTGSLVVLLMILLYRLLFGDGSLQQYLALREAARQTHTELVRLRMRNQALEAEVRDLKSGLDAIEERARTELGMIDENETFYQFVKKRGSKPPPTTHNGVDLNGDTAGNTTQPLTGEINSVPLDADGSAAGRPNGPGADALIIPGSIQQSGGN